MCAIMRATASPTSGRAPRRSSRRPGSLVAHDRRARDGRERDVLAPRAGARRRPARAARSRRGWSIAHCSDLHPAERAADRRVQPLDRRGARAAGGAPSTRSRTLNSGNRRPYGRPVAGSIDDGPVVPWQPPSRFGADDEEAVGVDRLARARSGCPTSRAAPGRRGGPRRGRRRSARGRRRPRSRASASSSP